MTSTLQQELALAMEQPVIVQGDNPIRILEKGTPFNFPTARANYINGFLYPTVGYHRYNVWIKPPGEESLVKIKFKGRLPLEEVREGKLDMNITRGRLVYQKIVLNPRSSYTFDYVGYFAIRLSTVESQTLAEFFISYQKELENGCVERGCYCHGLISHPDKEGVTISRSSGNFCWVV